MFDRSASAVTAGFKRSLQSLGLDYVDIIFVHDVEFGTLDQILTETLPAVKELQDEGKVKHIGISGYPLDVLKEIKEKSSVPIDVVLSYSRELVFDHTLQEFIPFFQQNGMGIVNAALTGMGLLTKKGPPAWHPADSKLKELCRQAAIYADERGTDIAKLGIAHSLKESGCHSNLVGMSSMAELDKNLDVYYNGLNENEYRVLSEIKDKFFNGEKNYHWEGKEIESYLSYKKMTA
ncbi:L-galactose dehydrogenase [Nilaparvata lugens]|uniref:L-galactose dehydrogenase n=1 Tax=Nilaparvata lugens TaxID=108931 RepID=UPI00193D9235|nr:L-galactose dehydrogenase [Nilaparvata lugens]